MAFNEVFFYVFCSSPSPLLFGSDCLKVFVCVCVCGTARVPFVTNCDVLHYSLLTAKLTKLCRVMSSKGVRLADSTWRGGMSLSPVKGHLQSNLGSVVSFSCSGLKLDVLELLKQCLSPPCFLLILLSHIRGHFEMQAFCVFLSDSLRTFG